MGEGSGIVRRAAGAVCSGRATVAPVTPGNGHRGVFERAAFGDLAMNAKAIMTLALRLMGFWVLFHAVAAMVNLVAFLSASNAPAAGPQGETSLLIASGFALLAYASFAAALLLFAPAIASWFSVESASRAPAVSDRPGTVRDVYIIAARLLGLYSLLSAVPAAQRLARSILDYRFHSGPAGEFTWASLVEASTYLVGGSLLIFLAAGIADVFSRAHGMSERPTPGEAERPSE